MVSSSWQILVWLGPSRFPLAPTLTKWSLCGTDHQTYSWAPHSTLHSWICGEEGVNVGCTKHASVYTCTCTCMYVYIYIYVCMYVYMCVCESLCISMHVHVCVQNVYMQMYCHSSLYLNTHRGIGCIFVEMLTGKPLFPGMKVHNGHVHVRVAPEACSSFFLDCLGCAVLLCLVCLLVLLASFFLVISH